MSFCVRASIVAAAILMAPAASFAEGDPINLREAPPAAVETEPSQTQQAVTTEAATAPSDRRGKRAAREEAPSAEIRALIARHAATHGVPAALAEAVAQIESRYNPRASHAGNYGLMQIRLQTARGEGYSGSAQGLLDADTNANYGIKHLARAYRMANGDACGAIMRYQSGLRATRMSAGNRAYCAKAKAIMGSGRIASAS